MHYTAVSLLRAVVNFILVANNLSQAQAVARSGATPDVQECINKFEEASLKAVAGQTAVPSRATAALCHSVATATAACFAPLVQAEAAEEEALKSDMGGGNRSSPLRSSPQAISQGLAALRRTAAGGAAAPGSGAPGAGSSGQPGAPQSLAEAKAATNAAVKNMGDALEALGRAAAAVAHCAARRASTAAAAAAAPSSGAPSRPVGQALVTALRATILSPQCAGTLAAVLPLMQHRPGAVRRAAPHLVLCSLLLASVVE